MSWIAEYDTQGMEFPTCVHVTKTTGTMTHGATYVPIEEGKAVRAENVKLREQLEGIVGRSFRTADKMACLEAENARLRELVRDMADAIVDWYDLIDGAFACESVYVDEKFAPLFDRMRELGVDA